MNTTNTGSRAISFCLTLLSSITESLSWTHNGRFLWSMHSAAGSTCSIGHQQGTINANGAEHSWKTGRDLAVANCQPCVSGSIQFQTEGIEASTARLSTWEGSAVNATVMNEERPYSVLDDVASELSHLSTKSFCCAIILPVDYLYSRWECL